MFSKPSNPVLGLGAALACHIAVGEPPPKDSIVPPVPEVLTSPHDPQTAPEDFIAPPVPEVLTSPHGPQTAPENLIAQPVPHVLTLSRNLRTSPEDFIAPPISGVLSQPGNPRAPPVPEIMTPLDGLRAPPIPEIRPSSNLTSGYRDRPYLQPSHSQVGLSAWGLALTVDEIRTAKIVPGALTDKLILALQSGSVGVSLTSEEHSTFAGNIPAGLQPFFAKMEAFDIEERHQLAEDLLGASQSVSQTRTYAVNDGESALFLREETTKGATGYYPTVVHKGFRYERARDLESMALGDNLLLRRGLLGKGLAGPVRGEELKASVSGMALCLRDEGARKMYSFSAPGIGVKFSEAPEEGAYLVEGGGFKAEQRRAQGRTLHMVNWRGNMVGFGDDYRAGAFQFGEVKAVFEQNVGGEKMELLHGGMALRSVNGDISAAVPAMGDLKYSEKGDYRTLSLYGVSVFRAAEGQGVRYEKGGDFAEVMDSPRGLSVMLQSKYPVRVGLVGNHPYVAYVGDGAGCQGGWGPVAVGFRKTPQGQKANLDAGLIKGEMAFGGLRPGQQRWRAQVGEATKGVVIEHLHRGPIRIVMNYEIPPGGSLAISLHVACEVHEEVDDIYSGFLVTRYDF